MLAKLRGAAQHVQRRAPFRPGFSQRERTVRELQSEQRRAHGAGVRFVVPVQTACDHQVDQQPAIVVEADRDALAEPTQCDHPPAFAVAQRRLDRPQQKRILQQRTFEFLTDDALLQLEFTSGTLTLTEAGTKRRASLYVVKGSQLSEHDRGGLEVMESGAEAFRDRLARSNHTLKRALTDPTILSGIGNAYSDEILHAARLSPLSQTRFLDDAQWQRLYAVTRETLEHWTEALRRQTRGAFPEKVTAFHEDMAVHGRYGKPCPVCATAIQRIRYADNETNYCPRCQTGGKLLADRSLSRLLKGDWPRTIEELENRRRE